MKSWPHFSVVCRKDVDALLASGPVSPYRSNQDWGVSPRPKSNVAKFERELERAWKVKHAVFVNSGTMALTAALRALELPPGSEVLTTPFSFSATPAAILLAGYVPRFADIDPHHFCLSAESVKKSITRKTRAILNVDLFGYLPDYSTLKAFGLPVIQDNCQAAGAVRDGKHLHGVIACGSGNGSKNLPCVEAGWAYTDDERLADRMRRYISHEENFGSDRVGVNGRGHELVAVLARHGLRELDERNERRRRLVEELNRCMVNDGTGYAQDASGDPAVFDESHVYYVVPWVVQGRDRAKIISRCAKRGLAVQESYTTPLHHLKAFRKYCKRELPVVDELHSKTLCLLTNLTPDKGLDEARRTAKIIREALE